MNSKCPICLVKIRKTGHVTFKCGHQLHLKCYLESLKHAVHKCPLCRKNINENKKYFTFLNTNFELIINKKVKEYMLGFFDK